MPVFYFKQCLICADVSPDSDENFFFFKLKNILMDLFLTNMQHFGWQDVNWWTVVVWITCELLRCFYQLFGPSFWRHPFTADYPSVSKWCNATFLQICSDKETNSSTSQMAWGWVHFWQTIPLKAVHSSILLPHLQSWDLNTNVIS